MRSIKLPSWIERLLGVDPRPVPSHVFAIEDGRMTYADFERRQGLRSGSALVLRHHASIELPEDVFQSGLLGGPVSDEAVFEDALEQLLASADMATGGGSGGKGGSGKKGGRPIEACLVVPDAWLRLAFSEIGELPRTAGEREQVLRWKLKRLVPFRVDELRVQGVEVVPLSGQPAGEPRRLLLGFALERLMSQLEDLFGRAGVRLGWISNHSLSLLAALDLAGRFDGGSDAASSGTELVAVARVREDGYSLLFTLGGDPVLQRYKAAAGATPEDAAARLVRRDLRLTRSFLEEKLPGHVLDHTLFVGPSHLEDAWTQWLEEGLGAPVARIDEQRVLDVDFAVAAPSWSHLAPLVGAVRQEVA